MPLTFHWLSTTTLPVHGESLKPETFEGLSPSEAARLSIGLGNAAAELGDLFRIEGTTGDDVLKLKGDLSHIHGIGQDMSRGTLEVRGPVGSMLGSRMSGGVIDVHGPAGDWVGAEMAGGLIRVWGEVGDAVGAPYPGYRAGMRDGTILIEGSAGEDVGMAMRRGLIVVLGDVADGFGRGMIAGTVMLGGRAGGHVGAGMKRGSLILFDPAPDPDTLLLPTFIRAGRFPASYLVLYKRRLDAWGFPIPVSESVLSTPLERYNGDTLNGGQGEVLLGPPLR